MDPPDSTDTNLNLSFDSDFLNHKLISQYPIDDDLFQGLFLNVSDENKESCVGDKLENDVQVMKSDPESSDLDEEKSPPPIIGKISAMIEKLKQQNTDLKQKSFRQECELADYEQKFAQKLEDLLKVQTERDALIKKLTVTDNERETLKLKVEEKEAELKQFKGLVQKQVSEEEENQTLKKKISNDAKLHKKTERDLQRNVELLSKNRQNLKIQTKRNKKLVTVILEFGEILEHKELLPSKHKKYLQSVRKKFQEGIENSDELNDSNTSNDENAEKNCSVVQSVDNLSKVNIPVFNGSIIKKEENSSYSNGTAMDSYSNPEVYANEFVRAIKSSPYSTLEDENFVNSTKSHTYVPSPIAKESDAIPHSQVACKTEETSNDMQNLKISIDKTSHLSPDSNFLTIASGTESLCSEDLDITDECFAEVKKGIKGWEVESAPMSPLPPSPSPKGNTEVGSSILQNQSEVIKNSGNTFSLVSTSPDPLSECIQQKNDLYHQNSSTLKRESERVGSSRQSILFSSVSHLNQQVSPTSPEPSPECTEKKNILLHQNSPILKKESEKNKSSDQSIPFSQVSDSNQNVIPVFSEPSFECIQKKNILLHQNSNGFEPHIEENSENLHPVLNNSTAISSCVPPPRIPPGLHYLSSTYSEDNCLKICHQGSSVYDYVVNPETKFSVCVLTVNPKKTPLPNQIGSDISSSDAKNVCLLPSEEERIKRVLTIYRATEKRLTLINNKVLNSDSSQECANNPTNENFPRTLVIVDDKNDLSINTVGNACALENTSDSGMDLDLTFEDKQKDSCTSISIEQQIDENQSFVSSSCDVSNPSKRKLTSSSFKYHSGTISKSTEKKYGSKLCKLKGELHYKDEAESSVCEISNRKKHTINDMEELPCKKLKLGTQLPNVSEGDGLTNLHSDNRAGLSVSITHHSPKNSQLKSKISPSKNQTLSNASSLQLELQNSPSKSQYLINVGNSQLELQNSPLKNQLLSNSSNPQLELQNFPSKNESVTNVGSPQLELQNFPSKNESVTNVDSPQLELQNSPSKNESVTNVDSPQLELQNVTSKNESVTNVGSPQLQLQNSPSKNQPVVNNKLQLEFQTSLSKSQPLTNVIGSAHLELKSSPKYQPLSSFSIPKGELKNSPSKNQPLSNINNSPSKNQPLSNINDSQMELKNSPSKTQPLSNVCSPQVELKSTQSNNQSLSSISSPQLELKKFPSVSSPVIYSDENSLVIDEGIEEESDLQETNTFSFGTEETSNVVDNAFECSGNVAEVNQSLDNLKKNSKKKKKKKNKALPKTKQKKPKLSNEEESVNVVFSIPTVLKEIEAVKIQDSLNESHFKRYAHTLFSALINPSNASNTASVLFQVFKHLTDSRTNPLISFPIAYDNAVFFPLTERCIVLALTQAESKRKSHLKGLLATAISNLYLLVLSKESISKTGLGAFCRVFTQLCRASNNRRKPLMLTCELIKTRHKFAPILIACIMGVWPDLFDVPGNDTSEEERKLHSSIAYSLAKKPSYSSLTSADWKHCKAIFSKYLKSSAVNDIDNETKTTIELLEEMFEETSGENDYMMTDPLLIFAACKGWDWADKNLREFILQSLARYARLKEDERAFSLYCNLYADISLFSPDFEACSEIFEQLFILEGAFDYVKGCAARSMIKLYLMSKHKFPSYLYEWTEENESKLVGTSTELLLKQRLVSDGSSLTENDIIVL